jgi:hypothetical protein
MTKLYTFLATILLFVGCTSGFEEINTNPNAPETVDPQFLLTNVLSEATDLNTYDQGFRLSNYLTQFAASVEFERIDRYELGTNATYWGQLYGLLADIQSMQTVGGSNEAYGAVGDILKAWIFSQLTDLWGDVPYTEALMAAEGNTTPAYDTQESIYTDPVTGILVLLEESAATLSTTTATINGDAMYGGNLDQWVRLANALQVRYTLRISSQISDFSQLQALVDGGHLMTGNSDNAVVPYLAAAPNQWPMSQAAQGLYQEHRMTNQVAELLNLTDDPRAAVLYKPSESSAIAGTPMYEGMPNGLSRESITAQGINLQDVSLFGAIYRDVADGVDAQLMLYSEQQFALAEAALKGYITGDVEVYYRSAVTAHFDYLGVAVPADFFGRPLVDLTDTPDLQVLMTQKWLSLISNGHEAWFNIRRTGFPALTPGPDNLNNGLYPVRYLYPESEQAVNADNYADAVARIGGDNINSKGWWEQ